MTEMQRSVRGELNSYNCVSRYRQLFDDIVSHAGNDDIVRNEAKDLFIDIAAGRILSKDLNSIDQSSNVMAFLLRLGVSALNIQCIKLNAINNDFAQAFLFFLSLPQEAGLAFINVVSEDCYSLDSVVDKGVSDDLAHMQYALLKPEQYQLSKKLIGSVANSANKKEWCRDFVRLLGGIDLSYNQQKLDLYGRFCIEIDPEIGYLLHAV